MPIIPILVIFVLIAGVATLLSTAVIGVKAGKGGKRMKKTASPEEALREARKRLSKNPRDSAALAYIGQVAYDAEDWSEAFSVYELLAEMPVLPEEITQLQANIRAAIAAYKMENYENAYKYLVVSRAFDSDNIEVNHYLGLLEFQRNNFDKAQAHLQNALRIDGGHLPSMRALGYTYFKMGRAKEALIYIRKALEIAPNDKESLFTLAECYSEADQKEQAIKIYSHLRPDAVWGSQACLASGMINISAHQYEQAIVDFEIGLKHENMSADIACELRYQLANAHLLMQDISAAMKFLLEVQEMHENYKDTVDLIAKYQEMNANKNLQIYIMAPQADFAALCRKIVLTYFPKAKVKITKTQLTGNDWADLVADVDTPKWSDTVMFRFVRTQGAIGELVLRDFHSHIKDSKASKGICIAAGSFSEEAKRFTESRLIDLIGKERLSPILNTVDSKIQAINSKAASKSV